MLFDDQFRLSTSDLLRMGRGNTLFGLPKIRDPRLDAFFDPPGYLDRKVRAEMRQEARKAASRPVVPLSLSCEPEEGEKCLLCGKATGSSLVFCGDCFSKTLHKETESE